MSSISVTKSGPFFRVNIPHEVGAAIDEGLNAVALHGQGLVQVQLTPGHGVKTGYFRRSVHGGLVSSRHAQIDAGLFQQGANVVYTSWLETGQRRGRQTRFPGYHMFERAFEQLKRLDMRQFFVDRIVRRLS